ncbi:DUF4041 domain-containing protein [Granulosicoccus antarcticus]|uniref:Bacteriophage T5 Orf172 DNA-binding domain-containing protein n=1 Tax=Granulosicoccus antarcticus IMCC3135 TaxID=1192854 RepID=A0A2Z2NPQ8_9GAMM|nr:DUF4041 domain-containing protein [Granulosicoccus antarcticus]ASJ73412.1 hypothetical protein IMCC3135_16650 [Granulosicoccus antarcticus IMCC3135]
MEQLLNESSRWALIDGYLQLPITDLLATVAGLITFLLVCYFVTRYRIRRFRHRYNRVYRSLEELNSEFVEQQFQLVEWQDETARQRHRAKNDLQQLTAEVSTVSQRAAEMRPVYEALQRRQADLQDNVVQLEARHSDIVSVLDNTGPLHEHFANLNWKVVEKSDELVRVERQLQNLRLELDLYDRQNNLVAYAHYAEPEYLHQSSDRFKIEVKRERDFQKALISEKKELTGLDALKDASERTQASRHGKLLIRAFNLECDKLFATVRHSNYAKTVERVGKLAHDLEKLMNDQRFGVSLEYVESKLRECTLIYQDKYKAKEEADEQRQQREQLREERKAQREYKAALKKAQDEEKAYQQMLEKARREISEATGGQTLEQQERFRYLEEMLEGARQNEQRAMSMAQQTRCGFIYVISNEGSFGKGIYKIGLTRRLEPMDRVKELGDASVPFSFDVHGIIYSEDAPKLENELHRHFDGKRVNVVNNRKEFFRVELNQIEVAINELMGEPVALKREGFEDDDYSEAMRLRNSVIEGVVETVV